MNIAGYSVPSVVPALLFDYTALGIFALMIVSSLLQAKGIDRNGKRVLWITIDAYILLIVLDIICWTTELHVEFLRLYELTFYLSYALMCVAAASLFGMVCAVISDRVVFSKAVTIPITALFWALALCVIIPGLREEIFVIDSNAYAYCGKYFVIWIAVFLLTEIGVTLQILLHRKEIGTRDTIVISVFSVLPNTVFAIDTDWRNSLGLLLTSIAFVSFYVVAFQNRMESLERAKIEQQLALAESKTKIMLSQIQPHFLYNTLTTIAFFCKKDPEKAEILTNRFAAFLQNSITFLSENERIPFSKELENIDNYLEIEKCRFKDRLKVEYDIMVNDMLVPMLSVQPIVENAVKHGICKKVGGGTIRISTFSEDAYNVITVKDDGVGFDPNAVQNDGKIHVGLSNATDRIQLYGGEITVDSTIDHGTTVTIYLPKEEPLC